MTVTTNEYGQNNLFAKEPQMVVEDYNRKGLFSPMQYREMYNGRWAMDGNRFGSCFLTQSLVNCSSESSDLNEVDSRSTHPNITELGWDVTDDDLEIQIGGTSVYEIEGLEHKVVTLEGNT